MALYKRPNSRFWWINIPRGKGVPRLQVSSGTDDETAARMIEQTLKAALRKETPSDKLHKLIDQILGVTSVDAAPLLPLTKVWDTYVASPSLGVSEKTKSVRKGNLKQFFSWLGTRYPTVSDIGAITLPMAFAYADYLAEETETGKTYNEHRANLSHIWKSVATRAGLERNVWNDIPRASVHDSQSGRAFDRNEVTAILKAARTLEDGWWYGPSLVALFTGLRFSSIQTLRWRDIQDGWLVHTPPKTQKHKISVRIPLHASIVNMLGDLKDKHEGELIFPYLGTRRSTAPSFSDVLAAAGVDTAGHVTFHCWRHTFRTRLAQARVSEDAAKRLGGWTTDINLIYNHDETQLRDAIDALEPI